MDDARAAVEYQKEIDALLGTSWSATDDAQLQSELDALSHVRSPFLMHTPPACCTELHTRHMRFLTTLNIREQVRVFNQFASCNSCIRLLYIRVQINLNHAIGILSTVSSLLIFLVSLLSSIY